MSPDAPSPTSAGAAEAAATDPSGPKTTRPEAKDRRLPEAVLTADLALARTLDAVPDRIDVRDWFYQPRLGVLPDVLDNGARVPAILDQGREGACTGFALAAVINFLLAIRGLQRRVSPRMLYEMARRYDEWPGEAYEGSSARGAMIGWVRHGVCERDDWPDRLVGPQHLTPELSRKSRASPGGAFYRVQHREVRDLHVALAEVGILYCTLMVHRGWGQPGPATVAVTTTQEGATHTRRLPVICRNGRADGGHAVALVGYTEDGLIVQNSWGEEWGAGGFALLPYEDYLMHATDVWVAQLGVPVKADLGAGAQIETRRGLHRASAAVPLSDIRDFTIDIGPDGRLSDSGAYWTTEADVERLFHEVIPRATQGWHKRRVLLFLHGGLNDETDAARRIVAFRDVMLANQIYPLHVMWETGAMETLNAIIHDFFVGPEGRASAVGDWLNRLRSGLTEAKDRSFEFTVARAGTALWDRMKETARRAAAPGGAMPLVVAQALAAMAASPAGTIGWELHLVGHSAGSIFAAHALPQLLRLGVALKAVQLLAPAVGVELFKEAILPQVLAGNCPHPVLYLLSDPGELDDNVGPYGKSLLYLVSNAFEGRRGVPLLGMARFVSDAGAVPSPAADGAMVTFFKEQVGGLPSLVIAGADYGNDHVKSKSETHGGFDNDEWTMNSVLFRILGTAPVPSFTMQDMQFDA